jgi:biopolymer transport protein ExbD
VKFRRSTRPEDSVNLTPLIDVVFLLLIFFMVSTTFTRETELSVNLPEASAEPREDRPEQLEVLIDVEGRYAVNGRLLVNDRLETLVAALREESGGDLTRPLVISADARTPHQAVVRAMEAAGNAGLVQLSIATREPAPEGA